VRPDTLHVLVVTRSIAPIHGVGGLERHGRDLLQHLLERGVRVSLLTQPPFSSCSADDLRHDRLTTHFVPYWTFPGAGHRGTTVIDRSTAYPWFGRRAGRLAAQLVRSGGIHIVHGMGAATLGYAAAREADRYETVPLLFNPHGMEEFGSTGPGLSSAKRLLYAPLRAAVRRCARAADRVVATDRVLVPTVQAHLHVDPSRIAVVPNAVDVEAIDRTHDARAAIALRERAGVPPADTLLVAVGRLEENKGFHVLIEALSRYAAATPGATSPGVARWRLALLGEGSQRARLERAVSGAGLRDLVLMPGRVSDAELHGWYDAADLFVHPSLYEGSSIVTLEAMAHRLPVVATRAGGLPDKVRPGLNGWLVEPGDVAAMAQALEAALRAPGALEAMGRESRAIVDREFGWPAVADRLLTVYDELLTTPSKVTA
jgi:glycogen synthase